MKKRYHLWVIEILMDGEWLPTIGVGFTRQEARDKKEMDWEWYNKDDKFKIRKYISTERR